MELNFISKIGKMSSTRLEELKKGFVLNAYKKVSWFVKELNISPGQQFV